VESNPLQSFLEETGDCVVLDGGLATALEERGHILDTALWSARILLDQPEAIRDVHLAYLEAGSDCITTSSYQASFEGFASVGLSDRDAEAALLRSSSLALEARDAFWARAGHSSARRRPLVAASIGPYGAYLADGSEYDGRYGIGVEELEDFHRRRFRVLATSGVDLLACETIPSAVEAEALLRLLDEEPGDIWAWMSFSARDGESLWDGSRFEDVVGMCVEHERIAAIGVNCTDPDHVVELIGRASTVTELPLIVYPNSGEQYDASTRSWVGEPAGDAWMSQVQAARAVGARGLGGCCRIGPPMVTQLRLRFGSGDWSPGPPHPI
jgi:homocysteine S-methyltransferase